MRQHVNPLSRFFQLPLELPEPHALFEHPSRPLHLDIGSARGKFLLSMASCKPEWNFLGVEIRRPLVITANRDTQSLGLTNIGFLFCNANVSLESWLRALPNNLLQRVSIQFPDPWFKRRHQKRRVLQPSLLISLAEALQPGGELFIQSDLLVVIKPMLRLVELSSCFSCTKNNSNPFPFSTEREKYVLDKDRPVYRALYQRNYNSPPDLSKLDYLNQD